MGKRKLLILLILFSILGILSKGQNDEFEIIPKTLYINWTYNYSGNVTINSSVNYNFSVTIINHSSSQFLFFNYTNQSKPQTCNKIEYCIWPIIVNETGHYSNFGEVTTEKNHTNFTLIINPANHPPGRYWGCLTVNTSNSSKVIEIIADLEIKPENNTANFSGILPFNPEYHSFYFNTSSLENSTSLTLKFNSSKWADVFILEDGELKEKGIGDSLTKSLFYQFFSPKFLEIRVYGNESSGVAYEGKIILSTLNSSIQSIDYGEVNVSNFTKKEFNLTNIGNVKHENVSEKIFLYYVKRFSDSEPKNFSFLVPDFALKIKARLIWNGNTNYSLILRTPSKKVFESVNKHLYSKIVGVEREEFLEVEPERGYWEIEVKNHSSASDYNLTIYLQLNSSDWFSSNFSTQTFNENGNSAFVEINFTARKNSLDGEHEGYLEYSDLKDAGIRIPFKFNLTAPMLIVNNTLNSSTIRITENIDSNLTKTINVSIKNEGSYGIENIEIVNSSFLNCSSDPTKFIRIKEIEFPQSLGSKENSTINITLEINTTETNDTPCLYKGWIFISTNKSEYAAIPYDSFNLTLEMNLTNKIIANITGIEGMDGDNWVNLSSSPENMTVKYLNLFYINGTKIVGDKIYFENITQVNLRHKNLTSYLIPTLKIFKVNGFEVPPSGGDYTFNFTVPENKLGGIYSLIVKLKTANGKLEGEASNGEIVINDSALVLSLEECDIYYLTVDESKVCRVRVKNYGPLSVTNAKLKFIENCAQISSNPTEQTISLNGFDYVGKVYNFTISATTNGTCNVWINISNAKWYEESAQNFNVVVEPKTQKEEEIPSLPFFVLDLKFSQVENLITVEQNSSNFTLVKVKNVGNISATINFSVDGINSSWYKINSTNATIRVNEEIGFLINFSVGSEEIGDYSGSFNVKGENKLWGLSKAISSNFVLRILPSNETKKYMEEKIIGLQNNASFFALQIAELEKRNYNLSVAKSLMPDFLKKIEEVKNYFQNGSYLEAYSLLKGLLEMQDKIYEEIINAKRMVEEEEEKKIAQIKTNVILIITLASVGIVLTYLFWPVKPKKFYVLEKKARRKKAEIWEKLKKRWDEIFEKRMKK